MYPIELSKEKLLDLDVLILRNLFQGPWKWKTCATLATKRPLLSRLTLHSCLLLYFFISPLKVSDASINQRRLTQLLNCQGWLRNLLTHKLLRWLGNVNAWQAFLTEEMSDCCHILLGLRLMVLYWLEVWLLLFARHLHKDHFNYETDCDIAMFAWELSVFCDWLEKRYLFWLPVSGNKSSRKHDGT